MSVLVTGSGGYLGRPVVSELIDAGCSVTAVVRTYRPGLVDARASIVEADVLSPKFAIEDATGAVPDRMLHLAWNDGFDHNAVSHMQNLSSHFSLLENAAQAGVESIAALGTMHEIGYWEGAVTADTPTNPQSLYGVAKDALRRSVLVAPEIRGHIQWLRCFYIVGDDLNNRSIFTRLLEAHGRGEREFPFTSGSNKYDFIDLGVLAKQIAAAVLSNARGVINCSSGKAVSLRERVEQFIRDNQLDIHLKVGAYPDRPYDSPAVWGDASVIDRIMHER